MVIPNDLEIANSKEILKELGQTIEDEEEAKITYLKKFFKEYVDKLDEEVKKEFAEIDIQTYALPVDEGKI